MTFKKFESCSIPCDKPRTHIIIVYFVKETKFTKDNGLPHFSDFTIQQISFYNIQ